MRYGILLNNKEKLQDVDLQITPRKVGGKIVSGMVVGPSDTQNMQLIVLAEQGELKEYPQLGFGIRQYSNGFFTNADNMRLQLQLKIDGYSTKDMEVLINGETV